MGTAPVIPALGPGRERKIPGFAFKASQQAPGTEKDPVQRKRRERQRQTDRGVERHLYSTHFYILITSKGISLNAVS